MKKVLILFFILLIINGCQKNEVDENTIACEDKQDCFDAGFCKQELLPNGLIMEEECDCVENKCYSGYTTN